MADLSNLYPDLHELIARAELDPDAAAEVLLITAEYLRSCKAMPSPLVEHLAGAIEASMVKPKDDRLPALGLELHLTAGNRRRKGDWYVIGSMFAALEVANPKKSPRAVAKLVAANYKRDNGKKIDPLTVLTRRDEYLAARKTHAKSLSDD